MHRSSVHGIRADLAQSRGAYLYDAARQELVLDLFGMFSSLPLGYAHAAFGERFQQEIAAHAAVKITNCEMATDAGDAFAAAFAAHPSMAPFRWFHFSCTGALAIEAAIKTAIDYRGSRSPHVITFRESFHGINGYGGFLTDRFGSVAARLDGLPGRCWGEPLDNPVIRYVDGEPVADAALRARVLSQIADRSRRLGRDLAAVLVEPIQCTAGDLRMDPQFLRELRQLCTDVDVPLVFDEVQTGFGSTGTMWYFEQCGLTPDIVAFGKKAQTSGVMVREAFGAIFRTPIRLEVTWDGDLLDMIRGRCVLEAYSEFGILDNVRASGTDIAGRLRALPLLRNVRHAGLLVAFDFEAPLLRDRFIAGLRRQRAIANPTQQQTVRWRPHLAFTREDATEALARAERALSDVAAGA